MPTAARAIAPSVFRALGTDVHVINNRSDSLNINPDVGSTHIEGIKRFVMDNHIGAGRCLAMDEKGEMVDGDRIMYTYACYMAERGTVLTNTVVTTVMSNFGLYKALDTKGISYAKTAMGNKCVYEYMTEHGSRIGGE